MALADRTRALIARDRLDQLAQELEALRRRVAQLEAEGVRGLDRELLPVRPSQPRQAS